VTHEYDADIEIVIIDKYYPPRQKSQNQVKKQIMRKMSYTWPIAEADYIGLSSPYGERDPKSIGGYGDEFHDGVDMYGTWKARIYAIDKGKVVDHWIPPNEYYRGHKVLGGTIIIQHPNGVKSVYGHLSETFVHERDRVKAGDLIGRQGNTGTWKGREYPAHLHFELYINKEQVNPLKYFREPKRAFQYEIKADYM
jgi:murein DD-endopeptidase MepM/ murein hydrolase activator NlpD